MALKIYAVGDIMLGEQPLCDNFGVKKIIQKNGADFLFEEVLPLFNDGNIVFGNLECSFTEIKSKNNKRSTFFSAEPEIIHGLKNAHFNVLSVANNHIMENGQESFIHTIQTLKKNNITPVGIRKKHDLMKINGYTVAFLAYSFIEDHISDTCYNKVQSEQEIIEDIRKVKPLSDLIVVSLHWGYEYVPFPSPDQIKIGRALVDAGADIILGGHPHVTQSYEIYKSRPIIYSLGNFIFDQTFIPSTRESFITEINIIDFPDLIDVNFIPFVIDKRTYCPEILDDFQKDAHLKNISIVRNSFENRSISDYQKFIGDYTCMYNTKKKTAKRNMKVHFIKNFYRYSPSTFFGILRDYLGNKSGRMRKRK